MSVFGWDRPADAGAAGPRGGGAARDRGVAGGRARDAGRVVDRAGDPCASRSARSAGATDGPFCVNLVLAFEQAERLEVAVEEGVPWVSFSFGLRPELVARSRAGGARVLVQVASADAARAAADAGADALIVQGVEAGGHVQSVVGLLPLLAEVRAAVPLPLLAAGGDRRPGVGAGRPRRRRRGDRDGDVVRGQRRVRRPSALQGAAARGRGSRHRAHPICSTSAGRCARIACCATARTSAGRLPAARPAASAPARARRWPAASSRYAVNLPLASVDGDVEAMALYAGQGVA